MNLLRAVAFSSLHCGASDASCRAFDKVSTISGKMVDKLHAKGIDADAIELFPKLGRCPVSSPIPGNKRLSLQARPAC